MKQTLNKLNTFIFILLFNLCVTQDGYCLDEQTRSSRYTSWLYTTVEPHDDSEDSSASSDSDNFNQPRHTMSVKNTLYCTGTVIAFIAIPTIAYLLANPDQQTIKMTDEFGHTTYLPLASSTFTTIENTAQTGNSFDFFIYGDRAVKCVLTCIDGLSGLCETAFFQIKKDNEWVTAPGDCMTLVDNDQTRLTNILWNTGNSIMAFLMTKRA